nr:hypothetical protein [uncultured Pedobacter sp.]
MIKKYLLTCYFVFYNYYERIDSKYGKNTVWFSAINVLSLPFLIISMVVIQYLINSIGLKIPGFILILLLAFLTFSGAKWLIFDFFKIDKNQNSSQNPGLNVKGWALACPVLLYLVSILFFLIATYLKNGYIIKN